MHHTLFRQLALDAGASEVSQAVSMEGANAVEVQYTAWNGGAITIEIQGSNDLENWHVLATPVGAQTTSTGNGSATGITCAYIRIRITEAGGVSGIIVCAGVTLSSQ